MSKKPIPVVMKAENKNRITIKGSDIKARDPIHFDHIVHCSGTGAHKSMKAYSRKAKHKREDASFFVFLLVHA